MPLSRRYHPDWGPMDRSYIGMDFATILPPGVGIQSYYYDAQGAPTPRLEIWLNRNPPIPAPEDWYVDNSLVSPQYGPGWYWAFDETNPDPAKAAIWVPFEQPNIPPTGVGFAALALGTAVVDRAVYSSLLGGSPGTDYILRWYIADTNDQIWTRSALLLCSHTS